MSAYSELDNRPWFGATVVGLAVVGVHPALAVVAERVVDFLGEQQGSDGCWEIADKDACIVWVDALCFIEAVLDGYKLLVRDGTREHLFVGTWTCRRGRGSHFGCCRWRGSRTRGFYQGW